VESNRHAFPSLEEFPDSHALPAVNYSSPVYATSAGDGDGDSRTLQNHLAVLEHLGQSEPSEDDIARLADLFSQTKLQNRVMQHLRSHVTSPWEFETESHPKIPLENQDRGLPSLHGTTSFDSEQPATTSFRLSYNDLPPGEADMTESISEIISRQRIFLKQDYR